MSKSSLGGDRSFIAPLVDDTCDRCERRESFGYRDRALAEKVAQTQARCLQTRYLVIESHMELFYPVRYWRSYAYVAGMKNILPQLGCEIVASFDDLGNRIEP